MMFRFQSIKVYIYVYTPRVCVCGSDVCLPKREDLSSMQMHAISALGKRGRDGSKEQHPTGARHLFAPVRDPAQRHTYAPEVDDKQAYINSTHTQDGFRRWLPHACVCVYVACSM